MDNNFKISSYKKYLDPLSNEKASMISLVKKWANINSGSSNLAGVLLMAEAVIEAFAPLKGTVTKHSLEPFCHTNENGVLETVTVAPLTTISKRPEAPIQIILSGHLDTVFPIDSPFQEVIEIDKNTIKGPGVTDMKGGIVVMLKALETLEKSPFAKEIGWTVLFNPDEEIGSVASKPLLISSTKDKDIAFVFEPTFADGAFVNSRKGSAMLTLTAKGKAAHSGRDFDKGRNAITALAKIITAIDALNDEKTILNIGIFHGGEAINTVAESAFCRINIRSESLEALKETLDIISSLVKNPLDDVSFSLSGGITRPPKTFDDAHQKLFSHLKRCCNALGNNNIQWRPSGGVCDGNFFAAEGIPTIDTLGVCGGNIHTHEEYLVVDSLVDKAQLTALLLMTLCQKDLWQYPTKRK